MKRFLCLFLIIIIVSFSFASVCGAINGEVISESVEYYPDGSYGITETIEYSAKATYGSKTASKNYKHYNASNELVWMVKLTASFTYNGSTSSCTSATPSYTEYVSTWKVKTATASHSGNTATGNYTAKRYTLLIPVETVNKTLTLKCDKNGNVT